MKKIVLILILFIVGCGQKESLFALTYNKDSVEYYTKTHPKVRCSATGQWDYIQAYWEKGHLVHGIEFIYYKCTDGHLVKEAEL